MPRTGITEPQILAAIEALQGRGEVVSKITVRKELGDTGSYGTISAFLQRWREQRAQEAPAALALVTSPPGLLVKNRPPSYRRRCSPIRRAGWIASTPSWPSPF